MGPRVALALAKAVQIMGSFKFGKIPTQTGLKKEKKKAEKKGDLKEVSVFCNYIGGHLFEQGQYEEAITEHEEELALCEALEDSSGVAIAHRKIGECYSELRQFETAIEQQLQHLQYSLSHHDDVEKQRAYATLGRTYLLQCESSQDRQDRRKAAKKAEDAFLRSLEVCEMLKTSINNTEYNVMKTRIYLNLGLVYQEKQDMDKCLQYMKKAIYVAESHQIQEDLYRVHISMADIQQRNNQLNQALRHLEHALKCSQKMKNKPLQSECLTQKALLFCQLGDLTAARRTIRKAYKLTSSHSEQQRQAKILKTLHKLGICKQKLDEMPASDLHSKMGLHEKLGDYYANELGLYKNACDHYKTMLNLCEAKGGTKAEFISAYVSIAQTCFDLKDYAGGIAYYKKELECRDGNYEQMGRTWLNIAHGQELNGYNYEELKKSYNSALECAKQSEHKPLEMIVLQSLLVVQESQRDATGKAETVANLERLRDLYHVDEEESQEPDSQDCDEQSIDLQDLLEESDPSSDDEEYDRKTTEPQSRLRARRTQTAMFNKRNEKGETPLHRACIDGKLSKVKTLIEKGHAVNPRDYCGWLPIHEASNHGCVEIVEYLLSHGAWINDRGGEQCGGVTPLLDACNCGNVAVIQLLVRKGANVHAKDDDGETPLESLRNYRLRASDALSRDDIAALRNAENLLKRTMQGNNPHLEEATSIRSTTRSLDDHDDTPVTRKKKRSREVPKTFQRELADDVDYDEDVFSTSIDGGSSNDIGADILDPSQAAMTYQQAISGLGSASSRRTDAPSVPNHDNRLDPDTISALIPEAEMVGDDWLVEDLQPVKRRRTDTDGYFNSNYIKNNEKRNGTEQRNNRSSRKSNDTNRKSLTESRSTSWYSEDQVTSPTAAIIDLDEDDLTAMENSEHGQIQTSKTSRKSRQRTLTGILVSKRPNDVIDGRVGSHVTETAGISSDVISASANLSTTHSVGTAHIGGVIRLRIRIRDKLIMVPVVESGEARTVGWLAKEAAERYHKAWNLRPVLSLVTKDGAMLSSEDPVALLLSDNDEVEGVINSWDLSPLPERYAEACKQVSAIVYRNITNLLRASASTNELHLDKLSLRSHTFLPISRALQCQYALKELHLQGNRLGDEGLGHLVVCLPTLPSMTLLNLSCNNISSMGLKQLAESLHSNLNASSEKPLQILNSLFLSYNALGEACTQHLASLLKRLPLLDRLELESCDLTMKIFQHHRQVLAEAFQGGNIKQLNLAFNHLGPTGVELFLKCLNPATIQDLNLSSTIHSYSGNSLSKHIEQFALQTSCGLQSLKLDNCYIVEEHIEDICRMMTQSKNLQELSLCGNTKLDRSALCRILETAQADDSKIDKLSLTGCRVSSPLDTEFLDALNDKLCHSTPLVSFRFSCSRLSKLDAESLKEIWNNTWKESSISDITGDIVNLNIKDI